MAKRNKRQKLRDVSKSKPGEKKGKIPESVAQLPGKESTDFMSPAFQFKHTCEKRCQLEECTQNELRALINTLRKMGNMSWSQVLQDNGLNFKPADGIVFRLPQQIPPDANVSSLRVSGRFRLFGHRIGHVYHVIWFDRNHEAVPENKVRRA